MEKIIISDASNFYFGKEAIVKNSREIAGITVLWVNLVNSSIEFAICKEYTEAI